MKMFFLGIVVGVVISIFVVDNTKNAPLLWNRGPTVGMPGPKGVQIPGPKGVQIPGPKGIQIPGPTAVQIPGPTVLPYPDEE